MQTREELLGLFRQRYRSASKTEKGVILDEFERISGYHRKHAVRLLLGNEVKEAKAERTAGRLYDEAVRQALVFLWETADRICGKRLKAVLPSLIEAMERHGHLCLDDEVRWRLKKVSVSTIDRLLAPARAPSTSGRRRKLSASLIKRRIPVRTFSDWGDPAPGFFEGDFVAHCGGSMAGSYIHTFVLTDIASGWTDCVPLVAREQGLVVEALESFRTLLPIALKGLDTDNDSAFINESVIEYCDSNGIEFTRSRAYRKNDQAWVEQKNGAIVRRAVGYGRFEGVGATSILSRLFCAMRLFVNFFQPSFKLQEKVREGSKVHKTYHPPATPCDRLLDHPHVGDEIKQRLREQRSGLDPVKLLKAIRDAQEELAVLATCGDCAGDLGKSENLDAFLAGLSEQWRKGEARPTHRKSPKPPRTWRTRPDAFDAVWPEILGWLETKPDITARTLFDRLRELHPAEFAGGQLRTLQRRVRDWRQAMAKRLIVSCCADATAALPLDRHSKSESLSTTRRKEEKI